MQGAMEQSCWRLLELLSEVFLPKPNVAVGPLLYLALLGLTGVEKCPGPGPGSSAHPHKEQG